MFDDNGKYIDYVVTNVLRQVANYVPFDCVTISLFVCL
jgi:hypothetical protein